MNPDEVKHIATEAAREAVQELLLAMGANAGSPDSMIELQKDFAHIRAWRQSVDTMRTKGLTVATGIIVAGLIGLIWMAVRGGH